MSNLSLVEPQALPGSGWGVAEQMSVPKFGRHSDEENEDQLVVEEGVCYSAIDGVTNASRPNARMDGISPGRLIGNVMRESLPMAAVRYNTKRDIANFLTQQARSALKGKESVGYAACVMSAFFPRLNHVMIIGDSWCRFDIGNNDHNRDLAVDMRKARYRSIGIKILLKLGLSHEEILANDPTWPFMVMMTERWQMRRYTNSDHPMYGYGVINGENIPDRCIQWIEVPKAASRIILSTDGYPYSTLRKTSIETEKALAELLERDPLGISREFRSVRGAIMMDGKYYPPDDRAAIWLERIR